MQPVREELSHGAGLAVARVREAQAAGADVADGGAPEDPHDLCGTAAVVRDREDVGDVGGEGLELRGHAVHGGAAAEDDHVHGHAAVPLLVNQAKGRILVLLHQRRGGK